MRGRRDWLIEGKRRNPMAKRRLSEARWLIWVLLIVGIIATPLAFHAASILALSGPYGLTLLYPFVQIVRSPVLMLPSDLSDQVAQALIYLQFPFYGLLMGWLARYKGLWTAFGAVVFFHTAGCGVCYLLVHWQNPYLRF